MFRQVRLLGMFGALMLALALSAGGVGHAYAQSSPGCDTTGTVNGTAMPTYGTVGTTIQFRPTGFRPGENVSFFFTLPNGNVVGTSAPVPLPVNPDGSIGPLPFAIDQPIVNLATGRWAVTFVGADSKNTSIIYFCVLTTAQATAVAQPSNTPVPSTATSLPATATTLPATATTASNTATTVPAGTATTVATVATSPTVAATSPTVVATSPTAVAASPTTAATTVPVNTPTSVPATSVPPTVAPPTTAPTQVVVQPTAVVPVETPTASTGSSIPGMPTTGQSDLPLYGIALMVALSLLGIGLAARRSWDANR